MNTFKKDLQSFEAFCEQTEDYNAIAQMLKEVTCRLELLRLLPVFSGRDINDAKALKERAELIERIERENKATKARNEIRQRRNSEFWAVAQRAIFRLAGIDKVPPMYRGRVESYCYMSAHSSGLAEIYLCAVDVIAIFEKTAFFAFENVARKNEALSEILVDTDGVALSYDGGEKSAFVLEEGKKYRVVVFDLGMGVEHEKELEFTITGTTSFPSKYIDSLDSVAPKPTLVKGTYYEVKIFEESKYERAMCVKNLLGNRQLYFNFGGGDVIACNEVFDFKI